MDLLQQLLGNIVKNAPPQPAPPPQPKEDPLKSYLASVAQKAETNKNTLLSKSPFLQNLASDTNKVAVGLGSAADTAVKENLTNIRDAATGKLKVTPSDIGQGIKTTALGVGKFAQAINEGTISFGKSILQGLVGKDAIDKVDAKTSDAGRLFLKHLTGTEDVATAQEVIPYVEQYAKSRGATDNQAKALGGIGFFGLMAMNYPGFSAESGAFKLSKEAIDAIVKTEDTAIIRTVLEGAGMDAKVAEKLAPAFKYADNPKVVANVVEDIKNGVKVVEDTMRANPELDVKVRERGFGRAVSEQVPDMGVIPENYIQRNTDQLAIKAANLVKDDIAAAEAKAASRELSDEVVATGSELLKYYKKQMSEATDQAVRDTFQTKFSELTRDLSRKLTEAGRYTQAASILRRETPEGKVRFAIRQIELNNANKSAAKKQAQLTDAEIGKIYDTYTKIEAMPESKAKDMAFAKAEEELAKQINPPPWYKKLTALWKAGLLTGIRTSGLNITSTAVNTGLEAISRIPAAAFDSVTSLITGKRTVTASSVTARRIKQYLETGVADKSGFIEGAAKGWEYLKTGYDERSMRNMTQMGKVDFGNGPVAKALNAYVEGVFRVVGSEDMPFFYGARSASVYDQAVAASKNAGLKGAESKQFIDDLLKNPTDEMLNNATSDALIATFTNNTYLGNAAVKLQEVPVLGDIVVPFTRTPGAIAVQVMNYTPVGPTLEIAKQIQKRVFSQRDLSKAIGRGVTGMGAMYLGYQLYKNGLMSLNKPTAERQAEQARLEGRKENTIKIGNKWLGANAAGPIGLQMILGGYIARGIEGTGSVSESIMQAALGMWTLMTEQSFMQGVERFTDVIKDPEHSSKSYAEGLIGSVVPTIIADVAQGIDPYARETPGVFDTLKARTPWIRYTLQPQIDALGGKVGLSTEEAKSMQERGTDFIRSMLDFSRSSDAKSTPLVDELKRLEKAGYPATPIRLKGKDGKDGFDALSAQQNTKLWIGTGALVKSKLDKLIVDPRYQQMDDEQKARTIKNITDTAKVVSRAAFVDYLTAGLSEEDRMQDLAAYKKSGLLTKEVFNAWQNLR